MKSDYPFPDKCEKCIHNDVCHMVGECLNHVPGFECDCFEEKRPQGSWIEKTGMRPPEDKGVKFCSNCMNRQPRDFITHKPIEPDFCPICGASMKANDRQVVSKLKGWRLKKGVKRNAAGTNDTV